MNVGRIVVKNNYEKRGDLVLRSYIRALKKIKAGVLLREDHAYIYGNIGEDGKFYEFFTKELIDYNYYDLASPDELYGLNYIPIKEMYQIKKIIDHVLFRKDIDFNFEISSIEELAEDRAIEFEAYNNYLSRINPYMRLDEENQDRYNAYNNFEIKLEELKKMRELDRALDFDEYDIKHYESPSKILIRK